MPVSHACSALLMNYDFVKVPRSRFLAAGSIGPSCPRQLLPAPRSRRSGFALPPPSLSKQVAYLPSAITDDRSGEGDAAAVMGYFCAVPLNASFSSTVQASTVPRHGGRAKMRRLAAMDGAALMGRRRMRNPSLVEGCPAWAIISSSRIYPPCARAAVLEVLRPDALSSAARASPGRARWGEYSGVRRRPCAVDALR